MTRDGQGDGARESDDDVAPGGLDVSPDSDGEGSQSEDVAPFRSAVASAWWQRILFEPAQYELTRFAVLRLLGFVYFVAFGSLALQVLPLYGSHGLAPIAMDLPSLREQVGASAYWRFPTLFWFGAPDGALIAGAVGGTLLSLAVLAGVTNGGVLLALWVLYGSYVHGTRYFYWYGWEMQLLETGLLAVFMCPWRTVRPWPAERVPVITIWLLKWIVFRVMVGSALIKLRGDPCWRDLTCLDYHFETQPNPNPLSPFFHFAPHAVHAAGIVFTHFVELVVPWFAFGTRRIRHAAGVLLVLLQVTLIASGNLSFLNWLTIVPALACFDDTAYASLLRFVRSVAARVRGEARPVTYPVPGPATRPASRPMAIAAAVYGVLVAILSVPVVLNLLSSEQEMNASFEPLDLVNTYGAFGSVDRTRNELILEGSSAETLPAEGDWREYELPCMPGDPKRRPCLVSPYQHRLDWQMWFVGNSMAQGAVVEGDPWFVHLLWQLLSGEPAAKHLLAVDPFPNAPPRWIRGVLYRYEFAPLGNRDGAWWTRQRLRVVLRPITKDDSLLRAYVEAQGWPDR
ncbi:MAG TPA: lipase maturation factor family protein [Polyangiaceae bacterium]|jgi:hypothetical protein|nr:lipase maturation factor family protein [Polyangiaceae bacterium]